MLSWACSNCGISVKFSTDQNIKTLITYDIEKLYEINDMKEKLIYRGND
jgi:Fe-S cluster biogenesis protein NfuA